MKVLHVISGISKKSGGPSRSSQGLVAALCVAGVDTWIHSFDGAVPWVKGVRGFRQGESLDVAALKGFDIVHIHGVWDPRLHHVAKMCQVAKVPYVIAPRGMLEPWSLKQKWLKKRIARFLYQDRDLRGAAALHATAESEAEQFRKLGFKNYCIVSPNGVNLPEGKEERVGGGGQRRALFVSRMHQKKGVLELVESWSRVRPEGWYCELVYTMNGDEEKSYESKVKKRVKELGLQEQFIFTGSLSDVEKWAAYARADLFVLPTYSENFGIVVAEALWAGVPVITTKGTPWQELATHNCGWWIDIGVESLVEALKEAMSLSDEERAAMGARGRKLVEEKYTWKAVVNAMVKGYEEILNGRT